MAYCNLIFQTEKYLKTMKNSRNFKQVLKFQYRRHLWKYLLLKQKKINYSC